MRGETHFVHYAFVFYLYSRDARRDIFGDPLNVRVVTCNVVRVNAVTNAG